MEVGAIRCSEPGKPLDDKDNRHDWDAIDRMIDQLRMMRQANADRKLILRGGVRVKNLG